MLAIVQEEKDMTRRFLTSLFAVLVALAVTAGPAEGQARKPATVASPALRTPDGRPDLQGFWDFRTATPLERPANLADKKFLTEEEANALQQQIAEQRARDAAPSRATGGTQAQGWTGPAAGSYNDFWMDFGVKVVGDRRTSLIVDPPDGRIPPVNPGVPYQVGSLTEDLPLQRPIRVMSAGTRAAGPEDRGLAERCIVGFNAGPPMLPSGYNNHMLLLQTSDYVAILNEMNHDVRIIPLDGRPGLPSTVRQWAGVSRGRWEGDTLVVKTTNFTDKRASFVTNLNAYGTGTTLTLMERFRRADASTLLYEFTVEDPVTFTRPFTAVIPMQKSTQPVFEYACHEGNYGLLNILLAARAKESSSTTSAR
jgi:hypothetical protein